MKGKMAAVYDITLSFKPSDKVEPTITNLLYGRKVQAHFYMKRIPFEEVPENEEDAAKFLYDMFVRKVSVTGLYCAIHISSCSDHKCL